MRKLAYIFLVFLVFIIGVLFSIEGIQWKVYNEVLKPCNVLLGANQRCVLVATPEFIE